MRIAQMSLVLALLATAQTTSAAVVATFSRTSIQIAGVTPKGDVVIEAALNEATGPAHLYTRMNQISRVLTDSDGDGVVTFDLGYDISPRSLWAIVDITSGNYAVVAPPGNPMRHARSVLTLDRKVDPEEVDQLISRHFVVSTLWVRPGHSGSAWVVRTADGASTDEDHKNDGKTVVSATAFITVAGHDKSPKKLKKDDLFILVDPFDMTYDVVQVTQ